LLTLLANALQCALLLAPLAAQQPGPAIGPAISGYVIDAEIDPAAHHLSAVATVIFTAPQTPEPITFSLHPALKLTKISGESGTILTSERLADGSIRITPATPIVPGQSLRWSFEYEGAITGNNDGPVKGQKLAAIQEPVSYLLGAARWFPVAGELNRFTAEMHIRVPLGMQVFASGSLGEPKPVTLADGKPGSQFSFNWTKPSFPGTVIAGRFAEPVSAGNVNLYRTAKISDELAQAAAKEYEFFTASFGAPESSRLNLVELPDDAPASVWAPELAAIPGSRLGDKSAARLVANTIARQWWGLQLSPRTLDDAWITNGMARYSELMFVESESGRLALTAAIQDVAAGALANDTIPLSSASRLSPFSNEFQSMTLEKGAMIFHMLRGKIGDKAFLATLKDALSQASASGMRWAELEKAAEIESRQPLSAFFAEWVNGVGAPRFTANYAVFRLGNNQGFKTIGAITQDLDIFRMPVELRIETDGKTETQKIEVAGAETPFSVESFGRPRRISIDPDGWVLKTTPELQVKVAILRGQQLVAEGDLNGALAAYQKALEANPQSSLANFRIGELLFKQRNYQASANAYRDALRGDDEPAWTEIWSHIALGKIFDLTDQRDRAVNEYRLAAQCNDNAQGAVNEAQMYLQKPYTRAENE
jgi:tetratricopeptide (TPR) repeat protein